MKKDTKKLVALLLVFIILIGVVACGGGETGTPTPPPGEQTNGGGTTGDSGETTGDSEIEPGIGENFPWHGDTSPITLDIYLNGSWMDFTWTTDIPTRVTTFITEQTGVTVNYIIPVGDETERLNMMIVSRDLPDIAMIDNGPIINEMADIGMFLDLTVLAEKYDSTFFDIVSPSQIELNSHPNGFFEYPNFAFSFEAALDSFASGDLGLVNSFGADTVVVVRKDIYEAIGSPDMTTPEGFINGLSMAKEMFPTWNGLPMYMVDFSSFDSGESNGVGYLEELLALPAYNPDGTLFDRVTDPDFVTWLKTYRLAYEMGLISRDTFIDDTGAINEKRLNGQYFMSFAGRPRTGDFNEEVFNEHNGAETGVYYIALDAIQNSRGDQMVPHAKVSLGGWLGSFISATCRDPARALRFLNYVNGFEGQHAFVFGMEGITFDFVDGIEVMRPFVTDGSISSEDFVRNYDIYAHHWLWWNNDFQIPFWLQLEAGEERGIMGNIQDFIGERMMANPEKSMRPEFTFNMDFESGSDLAISDGLITEEWNVAIVQLLTAPTEAEFDRIMNAFLARRSDLGFEAVMEARLQMVRANRETLGMD
jgi:putative aldouronate transport system substrate-binding protein